MQADDDDKFVGSRRRYFTQKTLDLAWTKESLATSAGFCRGRSILVGTIVFCRPRTKKPYTQALEIWEGEVFTHWDQVIEAYCRLSARNLKIRFYLFPQTDQMDLEVEGRTQGEVDFTLQQLAEKLRLDLIRVEYPYRYRQSADDFKIVWNGEELGQAVADIIASFFKKHVVVEATIEEVKDGQRVLDHSEDLNHLSSKGK